MSSSQTYEGRDAHNGTQTLQQAGSDDKTPVGTMTACKTAVDKNAVDTAAGKSLVQITTEGNLQEDRYWGFIRVDGKAHEWRATLPGYQLFTDSYFTRVAFPCRDVVIMDKKHESMPPEQEQTLVDMVTSCYQGVHDRTAPAPQDVPELVPQGGGGG